ncbi:MAG TPA: hypothetical protein PK156_02375 [Polyangium sp.]|nr:hypothetical protein [Polyangium sp.]
MPKIPDRSAYILELSVAPGGSRWAEVHVYSRLEHIRAWLEEFCKNEGMSAYHAIWYGATLALWVVQKSQVVQCIDLHPYIKASLGDLGPIPVSDRDGCLKLVRQAREVQPDEEEEGEDDDWCDEDIDILDKMKLELSWIEISAQLPALEPPLLLPGQLIRIKHKKKPQLHTYVDDGSLSYGSYDHEGGIDLDPPFEVEEPDAIEEDEDA